MTETGQVGLGWLVVDEQGKLIRQKGLIPEPAVECDRLGEAILQLSSGGSTVSELIQSRSSEPGAEVTFRWAGGTVTVIPNHSGAHIFIESQGQAHEKRPSGSWDGSFFNMPAGMYRRAADGTFLEVNPALAQLCGYDSPEGMLLALRDSFSKWYVTEERGVDFLRAGREGGGIRDFQSEVRRADGSAFWVAESARLLEDRPGAPGSIEGVVIDVSAHKAAERELSASRERFRRLLESVNVVPWEAEASTGRLRYVGPQAEQLLGFPSVDWLEPGFLADRLHPQDRDWVMIVRDDAIRTLGRFECEYRLLDTSGKIVWVRDIVSVVEEANGQRILGGFLHDITHRRASEEALRQSQELIEQIAHASPLIWYVLDLTSGRVIYLNGGGIRLLGYPADALLKMEPSFFVELGHPGDREDYSEYLERLVRVEKESFANREFRLRTAQGGWLWMRSHDAAFRTCDDGRVEQIVGTAKDMTLQKAALENLARSEALFRSLAETTNVIPFELEPSPVRFTYIGPRAVALFGHQIEDWLREDFWDGVVHPEDRSMVEFGFRDLMSNPDSDIELEFRLSDERGEYRWVRQVLRSDLQGENRWIVRGFILDISAAKSIEAEREESRRQLRELALENQRAREEERLAMSRELHDELGQALTLLRIDLTWIGSRISRAWAGETSAALQDKLREMEGHIGKTLQTLRAITTRLRPPILDELGLADAIEWQVRDFSRRVGIRCEVSAQATNDECKTTTTVVFRILQELLTNVARHSKASRVRVFLEQFPGSLTLTVSDNGCGFEVTGARRQAGLGLLGIRERAESLRGHLQIESRPGNGTTVVLSLPSKTGRSPMTAN